MSSFWRNHEMLYTDIFFNNKLIFKLKTILFHTTVMVGWVVCEGCANSITHERHMRSPVVSYFSGLSPSKKFFISFLLARLKKPWHLVKVVMVSMDHGQLKTYMSHRHFILKVFPVLTHLVTFNIF